MLTKANLGHMLSDRGSAVRSQGLYEQAVTAAETFHSRIFTSPEVRGSCQGRRSVTTLGPVFAEENRSRGPGNRFTALIIYIYIQLLLDCAMDHCTDTSFFPVFFFAR